VTGGVLALGIVDGYIEILGWDREDVEIYAERLFFVHFV